MFFFDFYYAELEKHPDNLYFFNPISDDPDDKSRAKNKALWDRVGFSSMYTRLLEVGCFEGLETTPLRSVRSANFVEAVRMLSLKNAGL